MRCLVTGASGFIGHHLARRLVRDGHDVTGVDVVRSPYEGEHDPGVVVLDLRSPRASSRDVFPEPFDEIYALAADMGGMGYIRGNDSAIVRTNTRINLNTLELAREHKARLFFASSACVYPDKGNEPLAEEAAYPAEPEDGYGWEKLFIERACLYAHDASEVIARIARFHNVYGPEGTYKGGREKAPAALCRKIATAKLYGAREIEIWGDGQQTRTFLYVDDCVKGVLAVMRSSSANPFNVGSPVLVTIDQLAYLIAEIAGWDVTLKHVPGPRGVRGRSSNNERVMSMTGWSPTTSLREGLSYTYRWVEERVIEDLGREGQDAKK